MATLYQLNPCTDRRWARFLERHPDSSVFHTPEWLAVLQATYGYEPIVYTLSRPGVELTTGHVFCYVKSWLTGRRLVSVPFSDHAGLLAEDVMESRELLLAVQSEQARRRCRYIEIRPTRQLEELGDYRQSRSYCWHTVALDRTLQDLFRGLHHSCIQRNILKAEREKVECSVGRSETLLKQFYELFRMSRRRHRVPPQSIGWFCNLLRYFGQKVTIRIALKNGNPIAGIMTLSHKGSVTYKYGGSDAKYHQFGGMPLLLWNSIVEAKTRGCHEFDLGRSDYDNVGLIRFKEHWGAQRARLIYWRRASQSVPSFRTWESETARTLFNAIPAVFLPAVGRMLYRHVG